MLTRLAIRLNLCVLPHPLRNQKGAALTRRSRLVRSGHASRDPDVPLRCIDDLGQLLHLDTCTALVLDRFDGGAFMSDEEGDWPSSAGRVVRYLNDVVLPFPAASRQHGRHSPADAPRLPATALAGHAKHIRSGRRCTSHPRTGHPAHAPGEARSLRRVAVHHLKQLALMLGGGLSQSADLCGHRVHCRLRLGKDAIDVFVQLFSARAHLPILPKQSSERIALSDQGSVTSALELLDSLFHAVMNVLVGC
mmetsp:Transcript_35073/g.112978  ORF Transcript_35073/g.112978 Transcript_35073/m.112978 type:complete len:250 (-) Transcript_35073:1847-2596(-)|eukprot:scaffold2405_cov113-Isochrysis_galbana.AAC.4